MEDIQMNRLTDDALLAVAGGQKSDIAVACASVLAREEFVKRTQTMSKIYGIDFAKGGGEIPTKQAAEFVQKFGADKLKMIARLMETSYEEVSKPALAKKKSNLKDSPDSYIKDLILSERRNKIQRLVELINQYEDNACPPIRELTINQK